MSKPISDRYARRAQAVKTWLDAKSATGSFLMGDDGPVTRREVLILNVLFILILVGAGAADEALWLTGICAILALVLVRKLPRVTDNAPTQNQQL